MDRFKLTDKRNICISKVAPNKLTLLEIEDLGLGTEFTVTLIWVSDKKYYQSTTQLNELRLNYIKSILDYPVENLLYD